MKLTDARLFLLLLLPLMTMRCASCTTSAVHPEAVANHDIGIEYLKQGQCKEAEARCRLALEYGPNFAHPYNCLGMIELSCNGDLPKASQLFKDALAINSDFAEAHNNLGTCFFRQNPPDYDAACDQFREAIEIDPGYLDARENLGLCEMRQGTILGDKGDVDRRTELYKLSRDQLVRLLEMNPNNYNARHHLGFMDLIEKKYASAEQNFKRCLEIDPENPVCAYNLGNTYLETSRCSDAILAYVTALRDKDHGDVAVGARNNLGLAYEACAKEDGAIREFLVRIKSEPGNPKHHYDLGNIYAKKGIEDKAVNEWENTRKLDPTYCPAYYKLAMHANKLLNSQDTVRLCQSFVGCLTEAEKNGGPVRMQGEAGVCKDLVKRIGME